MTDLSNSNNDKLEATGERLLVDYKNSTAVEHLHRYSIAKSMVIGKVVLDIACGEGYGSNLLAQDAAFVYGVDIASDAVSYARKKYRKQNLQFMEGSAAAIPLEDDSIDILVSFETIEHHDKHIEMMKECKRVLKPNGILIISSPDKKFFSDIPQYKNEFHVKELYKQEFYDLVKSYFSFVHLYKQGIVKGSLIYNEDGGDKSTLLFHTGDYEAVGYVADIMNPMYNLIIASNSALETYPASYFESDFVDNELLQNVMKYKSLYESVCRSKAYQFSRFLLLPARVVRKLFR